MLSPLLLTCVLGLAPASQDFPVAATPHFDVVCWFASVRFGDTLTGQASEMAERVWREARAFYGAPEDGGRIVLNVYEGRRGDGGYVDAVKAVEPSIAVSPGPSWVHVPSRNVYVRLQPVASDPLLERMGFAPQSLRRIGREVARLARADAEAAAGASGAAGGAGAGWLVDGAAWWLADRAMVEEGRALPGTQNPAVSTRVALARRWTDEGRAPSLEERLGGGTGELDAEQVEVLDGAIATWLGERLGFDGFGALAREGAQVDPGAWLAAALGLEDAAAVAAEFQAWLHATPTPFLEEYAGLFELGEGDWLLTAAEAPLALVWAGVPPAEEYVVRAEVNLFRDGGGLGHVGIALGLQPSGDFLSVAYDTSIGNLVWNYQPEKGNFQLLSPDALGTQLAPRRWYKVSLRVADGRVTGFLRDLEDPDAEPQMMRPFAVEGRDMSGAFGFTTKRNCGVLIRNILVEPYERKDGDGDDEDDEQER